MTDDEVNEAAWGVLLENAQSGAEDWIDEEGEFEKEDYNRVFKTVFILLDVLRAVGPERVIHLHSANKAGYELPDLLGES